MRTCTRDVMQKNDQLYTSPYIKKPVNSGSRIRITPRRKIYTAVRSRIDAEKRCYKRKYKKAFIYVIDINHSIVPG
jgi:hypothetical protein